MGWEVTQRYMEEFLQLLISINDGHRQKVGSHMTDDWVFREGISIKYIHLEKLLVIETSLASR